MPSLHVEDIKWVLENKIVFLCGSKIFFGWSFCDVFMDIQKIELLRILTRQVIVGKTSTLSDIALKTEKWNCQMCKISVIL